MTSKIKYPGRLGKKRKPDPLAEPLEAIKHVSDDELSDKLREFLADRSRQDQELLQELLDHYGIQRDGIGTSGSCWFWLSLMLARDHVPGFRYNKKRGPKSPWKWTPRKKELLVRMVEIVGRENDLSTTEAVNYLVKRLPRWEDPVSLYQRYMEFKKEFGKLR